MFQGVIIFPLPDIYACYIFLQNDNDRFRVLFRDGPAPPAHNDINWVENVKTFLSCQATFPLGKTERIQMRTFFFYLKC